MQTNSAENWAQRRDREALEPQVADLGARMEDAFEAAFRATGGWGGGFDVRLLNELHRIRAAAKDLQPADRSNLYRGGTAVFEWYEKATPDERRRLQYSGGPLKPPPPPVTTPPVFPVAPKPFDAAAFVGALAGRGISLSLKGHDQLVAMPGHALTDQERSLAREHRAAIVHWLAKSAEVL